jgi:iron complex outermembrane receptor protein
MYLKSFVRLPLALVLITTGISFTSVSFGAEEDDVEEIMVTSRRISENLQEVPVAVTAFNETALERMQVTTIRDLDTMVPNLFIGMNTAGPSAGAIFMRGQGYGGIEKTQTSPVGVAIDGVFMGSTTGMLLDTFDVQQIEVNRGPQGVLFGKNTSAGTIQLRRTDPTGVLGTKVSVKVGDYGNKVYRAIQNLPGDTVKVKLGLTSKKMDGYWTNTFKGEDTGAIDYEAKLLQVLWEPSDTFSAHLRYDSIRDNSDIPPQDPRSDGPDPFENRADTDEFVQYMVDNTSLTLEWDTSYGSLTYIVANSNSYDRVKQDFDGMSFTDASIGFAQLHTDRRQNFDVFTQELRLSGESGPLSYQIGAYLYEDEIDFWQSSNNFLNFPVDATSSFLGFLPPDVACAALGSTPNPGWLAKGITKCYFPLAPTFAINEQNTDSKSFFANFIYAVNDKLDIGIGARKIDEDKYFNTRLDFQAGGSSVPFQELGDSWGDTVTRLSADYQVSDDILVYVSRSEGFRSGVYSMRGVRAKFTFEPELVEQTEFGAKMQFMDGRATLNIAAFDTTVEGRQFQTIVSVAYPPGTDTVINNHAETELDGVEVEYSFELGNGFSLMGTYAHQEGETTKSVQSSLLVPIGPDCIYGTADDGLWCTDDPDGTVSFGGLPTGRTPEDTFSVGLLHETQIGQGSLTTYISHKQMDEFYIVDKAVGGTGVIEPKYDITDISVAYVWSDANARYSVTASGKNLSDTEYHEQTLQLFGAGGFQGWGAPQTWGLEFMAEF